MGFAQFREADGSIKDQPLYARFIDAVTLEQIGEAHRVGDLTDEEFSWRTPPADLDTRAILQASFNLQDWQSIIQYGKNYSYQYYNAPKINGISPGYGPVKSPNDETVDINGKNF
jgi:hypothetical protein